MIMNSTPRKASGGGVEVERVRVLLNVKAGSVNMYYTYYYNKNANPEYKEKIMSRGQETVEYMQKGTLLVIASSGTLAKRVTVNNDNKIVASSPDKTMFAINMQSDGTITINAAS